MNKDEEKDVAWYSAIVQAWFATRMEKDRSLLTLSAGAIGLLVALFINLKIESLCPFILFIFATVAFIVSLICLIVVFGENSKYLEALKNNKNSNLQNSETTLKRLDAVAYISFIMGIILTFIFAICIGVNYISKKEINLMSPQEKDKQDISPEGNKKLRESLQGADSMGPIDNKPNSESDAKSKENFKTDPDLKTSSFQGADTISPSEKNQALSQIKLPTTIVLNQILSTMQIKTK